MVQKFTEIAYATQAGVKADLLALDIYTADGKVINAPVFIMVHGGAWSRGDKAEERVYKNKMDHYVAKGFVFVSVNYRLVPDVQYPVFVDDVAKAISWVQAHIGSYGGDGDRIVLCGHSVGVQLATLMATDPSWMTKAGGNTSSFKCLICLDTAFYDIQTTYTEFDYAIPETDAAFGLSAANRIAASPMTFLTPSANPPGYFLAMSTLDQTTRTMSARFQNALAEIGINAPLFDAAPMNHRQINDKYGLDNALTRAGDAVIEASLKT